MQQSSVFEPLVSIIIINWNYGQYIGQAIESVKQQTYDNLEILIVDNASKDSSRQVIAQNIAGDKRFRLFSSPKNLGQLGAFMAVFPKLNGEFVVSLDSDDYLYPEFVSSHVQVHVGLPSPIALTSNDVEVVNSAGKTLLHGYQGRNRHVPDGSGLLPFDQVTPVANVDEAAYNQLHKVVTVHTGSVGWIWGPGSANMYRRSTLEAVYDECHQQNHHTWQRAADNFLNPLSHALGGSALLERELSAYRLHDSNYYGNVKVASGGRKDRLARQRQLADFYETTDWFMRRADLYYRLLGPVGYWQALRSITRFVALPNGRIMPGQLDTQNLLKRNYQSLCATLGKSEVDSHLADFFLRGDIVMSGVQRLQSN